MDQIKITYKDVAEYYMHLIRSGATEFTKPFNNLKIEGCTHNISIQAVNYILDHKYNEKDISSDNLHEIQANFQDEKNKFDTKIRIFRFYSQALASFADEPITVEALEVNTQLSRDTITRFLAEYNDKLDLKMTPSEQASNIRTILEKIWS